MERRVLKNGLKVIIDRRLSKSVVVAASVNAGAINETPRNNGISHFLEHMLFEGTKNRKALDIYGEVERVGGELNAATYHDRTYYYIKVPKKHFDTALSIMADMIQNPLFDEKSTKKERRVVLNEMNLTKDDPKSFVVELFVKHLFKKNPIKQPIIGTRKSLLRIGRKELAKFHSQYYSPNNVAVCVVGDVKNPLPRIREAFGRMKPKKLKAPAIGREPEQRKPQTFTEKRKILQSYLALGYKAPTRNNKDSYVVDVISAILGKGFSGRLLDEIRTKRGLAYDVGAVYYCSKRYGYFVIHADTNREHLGEIRKIVLDEIGKLNNITEKDLREAKDFIEGNFELAYESTSRASDMISYWETASSVRDMQRYISSIRKVKREDVRRVVRKYFKNYTMTSIVGK